MCKAIPPLCCNGNSDHHYLVSINDSKEPKTLTSPLISKTITAQPEQVHKSQFKPHKKSHFSLALKEANSIAAIAFPMILTSLLLYLRSMISMLFLGRLGELALAGGSLAVGFANITGYSILSGLAMGMEPICGQAFGAKKHTLLGLSLQRMILLLLFTSLPISLLWLNMKKILLICGQDEAIATEAQLYLLCSLPDLLAQSFLHPLRIYLRSQSITLPLTLCATLAIILHIPINYLLVSHLDLGIKGVALSGVWSNFNLVASVIVYIIASGVHKKTWGGISMDCFREWRTLLNLAVPSCISVCLEWWWYEIMILLCGLLINPRATVASMGVLFQTTALIYIFPSSLSFSVSTRVGNEIGANNPKKAKLAAIVGLCCSFMLGLSALVFATVRNIWATMFTQDKDIIALTSMVLPIIGLCELGNCPQTTGCGVLRGTRMEPICGQAFGAKKHTLLGLSLQRTVLLLLFTSLPISLLWLNMKKILLICGQDEAIAAEGTQNDSKEPKTLISPLISKTITPQPEQVHKTQFKPHKKSHFSLVLKEANSIAAIAVPMIFIVYLIFSSSNISPAMARPLNKEKPAWTGFMLYEIDRAPAPPTGPSKCIPPGRLNEHGDCPTPFHP